MSDVSLLGFDPAETIVLEIVPSGVLCMVAGDGVSWADGDWMTPPAIEVIC